MTSISSDSKRTRSSHDTMSGSGISSDNVSTKVVASSATSVISTYAVDSGPNTASCLRAGYQARKSPTVLSMVSVVLVLDSTDRSLRYEGSHQLSHCPRTVDKNSLSHCHCSTDSRVILM